MGKNKRQRQAQQKEYQLKELVDWSFQSYEDDMLSDEDKAEEPVAKWIVQKRQNRLPTKQPD